MLGIILSPAKNIRKPEDYIILNSNNSYSVPGEYSFCFFFQVFESSIQSKEAYLKIFLLLRLTSYTTFILKKYFFT